MSIFGMVGDMFKRLIATLVFLFLGALVLVAVFIVLALVYYVSQGHL